MSKNKKSLEASYYLNRTDMVRKLKKYRGILEKIALKGIQDDGDERVAKIACSILASDYHYEDSIIDNKSVDYNPLVDPPS